MSRAPQRPGWVAVWLALALAALSVISLGVGSDDMGLARILRWILTTEGATDDDVAAVLSLRAPRIAVAILSGAMLAASGYLLQIVANNGLADPGIIGISQGASAAILLGGVTFGLPAAWLAPAGLIGGLTTGILVLGLSLWLGSTLGLVLIGLAVSITLGAAVEMVMVSGGINQFVQLLTWSHGSLTAASPVDAVRLFGWAAALALPLLMAPRALAPLRLGSEQAAAVGANPRYSRPLLVLLAAALVAPVVTIAGPVSFVGLIAAHVARRLAGERPGAVLGVTLLVGALLFLGADTAGRTLFLPLIVPAGLLVSLGGVLGFLIVARSAAWRPG
ncbi:MULTISPECIES: iron ABC transporter permease [unclassified Brenneria]|uniref:FecCD family ABC transporter permease n=1 Tax=unclassified Brenneria TaxID=2634434 RepID=UPI0029C50766|nr:MULTISPECIES: iron ABC transporter permease [unclassified Brenneria]MDX5630595.1 iron ABC transporter permease [Brenneria sp. L3-3Z]MDX5697740.1 iron ABC transporter permease [Brenneria sp. L4-2C]